MSLSQRDDLKRGISENFSLLNLNVDMMKRVMPKGTKASNKFSFGLEVLRKAIGRWGIDCTLNFVRGGNKTFVDRTSYLPQPYVFMIICRFIFFRYRDAVATGYRQIEKDPSLMWDGRRVQMHVKHV